MIWGDNFKSQQKKTKDKCALVARRNMWLQVWHEVFTWRKVELLDGRFARLCYMERKFVLSWSNSKGLKAGIASGELDILDWPHGDCPLGAFEYRELGSDDEHDSDILEAANQRYWEAYRGHDDDITNDRREAILEQRARGSK